MRFAHPISICLLLISINFLQAQHTQLAQGTDQQSAIFKLTPEKADNVVVVLDSLINTDFDGPQFGVIFKSQFSYDYQARMLSRDYFIWDNDAQVEYQSNEEVFTYDGNLGTRLQRGTFDSQEPLRNRYKHDYIYSNDGTIEEDIRESWDLTLSSWNSDLKTILVSDDPLHLEWHIYRWEESIQDYEIFRKSEREIQGNHVTATEFNTDDLGEFVPATRRIIKTQDPTPYIILSHRQNYNPDTGIWEDANKREVFIDEPSKTGYQLVWNTVDDIYQLTDSSRMIFNSFLNPEADTTYSKNFVTGLFEVDYRNEYDYYPFERILQNRIYNFDGTNSEPAGQIDYYHSQITTTSASQSTNHFPASLQFSNPAKSSDYFQVVGPENDQYELWSTSQNGKLLDRRKVQAGDTLSFKKLQNSGLYYLTLFGDHGQRSWKVIIQ